MTPDIAAIAREQRAEQTCLNCGRARWRHHSFAEFGVLCPSNKGVGRFPHLKGQDNG